VKDYYSKLVLDYQSVITLNVRLCLSIQLFALIIRIRVLACAQSLSNTLKLQTLCYTLQETRGHNNVLVVAFYTREGGGYVSSNISKALPQTYAIVYNIFVVVFLWQ
jgi:hypothetical protein